MKLDHLFDEVVMHKRLLAFEDGRKLVQLDHVTVPPEAASAGRASRALQARPKCTPHLPLPRSVAREAAACRGLANVSFVDPGLDDRGLPEKAFQVGALARRFECNQCRLDASSAPAAC